MQAVAKSLPEGVVICSPKLIAGKEHLDGVLDQAQEYWRRREYLARNRSIDLLMRVTCQRQISEAVAVSGINGAKDVALFGLAKEESDFHRSEEMIRAASGHLERRDALLDLDAEKEKGLKQFHNLPSWFKADQLVTALKEKSVLLVFLK